MKKLLVIFILSLYAGCAQNSAEKTASSIDLALTYLSDDKCSQAIDVLEDAGYQSDNAIYLQVLASAYSCKAGLNEVSFLITDLAVLNTTSIETILTSLVTMSLSDESTVDSDEYSAIKSGINILLGSTSGAPSHTARVDKFGQRKAGDMGVQALILNLINLGKFLNLYGNVNAAGVKGAGANSPDNSCLMNYTDSRAVTLISSLAGGSCIVNNGGHPSLDRSTSDGKRLLCEGLVLLTNIFDILDELDLSASSELNVLEAMSTQIETIRTTATVAGLGALITQTSQSDCETSMNTSTNLDDMEYFYSLIYEAGLL